MKTLTKSLVISAGLVACGAIAAAQAAQKPDRTPRFEETLVVTATPKMDTVVKGAATDYFLNFSAPVGVPGVTLAAGTYLFRFPAGTGTGVIQLLKADRSNTYAMFMTIPVHDIKRSLSSDAQVVIWGERQAGAPPAVKEWYLPGQTTGYEFIYPKAAAGVGTNARLLAAPQSQQAQSPAPPSPGQSSQPNMAEMMKMHQQMMAEMKTADAKLDELVKAMNAATGDAKISAIAQVVNELVRQQMGMHGRMGMMDGHMMQMMMGGRGMMQK